MTPALAVVVIAYACAVVTLTLHWRRVDREREQRRARLRRMVARQRMVDSYREGNHRAH